MLRTIDCIFEYDGELSCYWLQNISETKTKSWIDGYFVQCAAYACMYYELTGIPVKKFVIIMSCENSDYVVYQEYDKMKYMNMLVSYIRNFLNFIQLNGKWTI